MVKVVLISLEWPHAGHVGGVGRYAFRIAEELRTKVDLTVVTLSGGTPLEGATMVYVPRVSGRLARYYLTPLRLRRLVASIEADVIHAFGDDWALAKNGAPIVRTFLGSSLAEARASRGLRSLNHYVLALTEAWSRARAKYRIAIGPDSFDTFRCDILMPPVTKVPQVSGVDKSEAPSVVFIGSFHGRKRGWLVARAVREAQSKSGLPITLSVIGPANDRENWSTDTIHMSGASDEAVRETVASSWVLMAPSEYEGFGIPLYEAMALGTYAIVTDNPGSSYIYNAVQPTPPISLVPERELRSELEKRIQGTGTLSTPEQQAASAAVDYLTSEASGDRLVDIYRRLSR
ncbi:glycosyltransferase [Agreia sp. VKM Ac-1783]|uniref:glycosyltransferase family 4 protein n=1 Tax=Agreia sp. VKM Ac-1783 TaxID=1938889 RepID=UPI000A2AB322|nr:glycosyltransferase [Agreia sp. VKM Ac-1783]SMQ58479.1 Glycosyltransferase involved in cell wall bisynthesis [Agreia sp. VKM Ac-1783]